MVFSIPFPDYSLSPSPSKHTHPAPFHKYTIDMFRYALSIRLGFMNQVWEKALKVSSSGKQDTSMGNIQTLMAVDPMRIMGGSIGVHWVWVGPVLIIAGECLFIFILYFFFPSRP